MALKGILAARRPFDVAKTLESGQVFTWKRVGHEKLWLGCTRGELVLLSDSDGLGFSSTGVDSDYLRSYFGFEHDLERIGAILVRDRWTRVAYREMLGLRLIAQDPWECLLSFALATNTSVRGVSRMMEKLRANFGREMKIDGFSDKTVPFAERLAKASVGELRQCGLGFRAPYISRISRAVSEKLLDLESLRKMGYDKARKNLLTLAQNKIVCGIGRKVADCILLYAFGFQEAVPVDRWVAKLTLNLYESELPWEVRSRLRQTLGRSSSLSSRLYDVVASFLRLKFAPFSGYAQLYLYAWYRPLARQGQPPPLMGFASLEERVLQESS